MTYARLWMGAALTLHPHLRASAGKDPKALRSPQRARAKRGVLGRWNTVGGVERSVSERTASRIFFKPDGDPDAELMPTMGTGIVNPLATVKLTDTRLCRATGGALGGA